MLTKFQVTFSSLFWILLTFGFVNGNEQKIGKTNGQMLEGMKCVCDGGCESVLEGDCPWGLTLDVCGCCFLCARGASEPCGGVHGTCGKGLFCEEDQSYSMLLKNDERSTTNGPRGTCQLDLGGNRKRRKKRRK